ncbi:hypothetical protein ACS0TY_036600 [Phlomoides rotata]
MAIRLLRTLVPCRYASGSVNATLPTFSRSFCAQSDTSSSDSQVYIVHLKLPSGMDVSNGEELESWYHSVMSGGKKSGIGADKDPRIRHTFHWGFTALLTRDEALALKNHDDFLYAKPSKMVRPATIGYFRAGQVPQISKDFEKKQRENFMKGGHINPMYKLAIILHHKGFHITFVLTDYNHKRLLQSLGTAALNPPLRYHPGWPSSSGERRHCQFHTRYQVSLDTKCENSVIIVVLDTSIEPSHRSFHDKGMLPPPTKWKEKSEFNHSSNKIIGVTAVQGTGPPFDDDGHGTHVTSNTAQNVVRGANLIAQASTTIAGVASLAHLAMKKAVSDGADIISVSFNVFSMGFKNDPITQDALKAIRNGIHVVCCAVNYGSQLSTIKNMAP